MEFYYLIFLTIASIGFISLSNLLLTTLIIWLKPAKDLKQYGSWAIITGCTDGIGKALAFETASKGLNLVLLGRNPSKLQETSNQIKEKFGSLQIETKIVTIDLAKCEGKEICRILTEAIAGLDIGILINNAGLGYPLPKFFHEIDFELIDNIIKVNIQGTTWVTKAVLPCMLKKQKGAIINIGSASAGIFSSFPLNTIYAATKMYVAMFSRSISLEYKQHGIDIQYQIPVLVKTKMTSRIKTSLSISPESYSKASLKWIGCGHICIPYWLHFLQGFIVEMLPDALLDIFLYNFCVGIRMRGMEEDKLGVEFSNVLP